MAMVKPMFITTELEGRLTAYVRRAKNAPMKIIADALITAIDDLIQSEGNQTWEPFHENTLRRHPERAGGELLQGTTGQLANIQHSPGSPGPDWVQIESPAPYSWYHVTGTHNKDGSERMPKRDFMDIDLERVLTEVADDICEEIVKG